jgi:hypothetical protein
VRPGSIQEMLKGKKSDKAFLGSSLMKALLSHAVQDQWKIHGF